MSKKITFTNFGILLVVAGITLLQSVEYLKARANAYRQDGARLEKELHQLETLTLRAKQQGKVRRYISEILEPIRDRFANPPIELAHQIFVISQDHNIDPMLVMGIIKTESDFSHTAVSNKGARGLMQLKPLTGKAVAEKVKVDFKNASSLFDEKLNLTLGVSYLSSLIKRFDGNLKLALEAYNRGPTAVKRTLREKGHIRFKYSEKVLSNYRLLSGIPALRM